MNANRILKEIALITISITVITVAIQLVCKLSGAEPNFPAGIVGGFIGGLGVGRVLGGWNAKEKFEAEQKAAVNT